MLRHVSDTGSREEAAALDCFANTSSVVSGQPGVSLLAGGRPVALAEAVGVGDSRAGLAGGPWRLESAGRIVFTAVVE
jgi:hypothetical protein